MGAEGKAMNNSDITREPSDMVKGRYIAFLYTHGALLDMVPVTHHRVIRKAAEAWRTIRTDPHTPNHIRKKNTLGMALNGLEILNKRQ